MNRQHGLDVVFQPRKILPKISGESVHFLRRCLAKAAPTIGIGDAQDLLVRQVGDIEPVIVGIADQTVHFHRTATVCKDVFVANGNKFSPFAGCGISIRFDTILGAISRLKEFYIVPKRRN